MESSTQSTKTFSSASPAVQKLLRRFRNPWLMRLYFLRKLPSLLFWRVRIAEVTPDRCVVALPFSWWTQNPFRSIYFAAQAGAAELSTGLLAMLAIQGKERVSMLVVKVESTFTKKANGRTFFECTDGRAIREAVQRAITTGESQTVTILSTGRLANEEEVSQTRITWSFKKRSYSLPT